MPFAQAGNTVWIVAAAVLFLFWLVLMLVSFVVFRVWFQARMLGVPLSAADIFGMKLRKIDAKAVLRALALAKHAGVTLSVRELQLAYLQGADLQKVTLAVIEAKRQNREITFSDALEAELKNRPPRDRDVEKDDRRRPKDERRSRKDRR